MDTSSSGLNYVLYAIYGVYVYICICVCVFVCVSIYTESSSVVSDSLRPHGLYSPWNSQARILDWVAVSFSGGSFQPRDRIQVSHIAVT